MATFNWTALTNGQVIAFDPFDPVGNPLGDVLNFDDLTISAANIAVDSTDGVTDFIVFYEGKTVTFLGAPLAVTTSNVTFANGSVLLVGDDTTGTVNDNAPNTLVGGSGDDQLIGLEGADSLAGGAGNDTLAYVGSSARVIVNMLGSGSITVGTDTVVAGTALDGFGTTDTISGFENVIGSAFDDFIIGNNAANVLEGRDGDDTLTGGGSNLATGDNANDTLLGGAGDDQLRQTRGADHLDGETGSDRLVFTNNAGVTTTGVIYGGAVGVNVNLAAHTSDYDTSDAANPLGTLVSIENVTGTAGNDVLRGGDLTHAPDALGNGTTESFRPLGGNDTIIGPTGNGFAARADYSTNTNVQAVSVNLGTRTVLDGQGGIDTLVRVDQAYGGLGDDSLLGGGQERAVSGGFFELFRGNSGNDTIDGAGTDTVVGAAGSDRANYGSSPAAVIVNLGAAPFVVGSDTVQGGTARDGFGFTDTLRNIDQVEGSSLNDTLVGGGSNHRLIGGAGNDSLVGGASGVEASYQTGTVAVVANLTIGTASDGLGGTDTLVNIDDLRGSDFDDTLTGNAAGNRIAGEAGADTIDGGGGIDYASYNSTPLANGGINAFIENGSGLVNDGMGSIDTLTNIEGLIGTHSADTLMGGAGDQWFSGRGGSDSINGGADNDGVTYIASPAGVTVNLGTGSATDGWGGVWALGGTDTLFSIENVEGSDFNDNLTGDTGVNTLDGGAGNDTLNGGLGNDIMIGGRGNDLYVRNATGDVVTEGANAGTDTVQSAVTYTLGANVEKLTLTGNVNINGTGNTLANTLTGNTGNNVLNGGAGNDTVIGGSGNDTMVWDLLDGSIQGGAGTDTLRVDGANKALDLTTISNAKITNVEIINLTGSGNNTLTLNLADVLALSSTTNTLRVDGNAGDIVHRGAGWTPGADQVIGAQTYDTFTQGTAILLVDTDVGIFI